MKQTKSPETAEKRPVRFGDYSQTASTDEGGLVCRKCGCRHFRVVYTRPVPSGIRRMRECRYCGKRLSTWERS